MRTTLYAIVGLAALILPGAPKAFGATDKQPANVPAPRALVTLDYVDAEVTEVIRALAAQSRINVALNPNVKGQITVHLRDKTVDEAMQVVANSGGLGAKKVNDTYVVAPRAEMRQTLERLGATRSVPLTYLTAQQAIDLAQGAFPEVTGRPQGKAVALIGANEDLDAAERLIKQNDAFDPGSIRTTEKITVRNRPAQQAGAALSKIVPGLNVEPAGDSLVLTGTRTQVDTARQSLLLIDVPNQPDQETRIYNIRYTSARQLVTMLEEAVPDVKVIAGPESFAPSRPAFSPLSGTFVGASTTGSSGGTNGSGASSGTGGGAEGSAGGSTTGGAGTGGAGTGGAGAINRNALTLLLKGPPAALDEAMRVLALADVAPRQMMIEARVVDTSPEATQNLGVEWAWNQFQFVERPGLSGGVVPSSPFPIGPLGFGNFGRVQFNPIATLNAMITSRQAKLLASPKIAVLNDQDASIFIGDTLRIQTLAQSSATAGAQFTVLEVPVGIILLVHPRVNDDGNITLRVHPVVSTVTGFDPVSHLPQTSAREAETSVRVKDGDTLVIGGLIRDEDIKQMSKIPLLGDLPIVGYLFRNSSRSHRQSEVMVFLTIHLMP